MEWLKFLVVQKPKNVFTELKNQPVYNKEGIGIATSYAKVNGEIVSDILELEMNKICPCRDCCRFSLYKKKTNGEYSCDTYNYKTFEHRSTIDPCDNYDIPLESFIRQIREYNKVEDEQIARARGILGDDNVIRYLNRITGSKLANRWF